MTSEDLIALADFKSIELQIAVTNTTSRTKIGADKEVRLVEFFDHGFALEVPKATCAQGHNLTVEITRKDDPAFKPVSVTGKVDSVARSGGGGESNPDEEPELYRAELTLVQYDEDEWQSFQDLFSGRQEEIERFLAAARGY